MIRGSSDNNRRNDFCICGHSLIKHTEYGCFYSQFRTPTLIQKYCSCRKFRSAKAKEKI